MAFPNDGLIKIFPATTQLLQGQWAFANDAQPQPSRAVGLIDAYYAARTPNLATAPCLRRATEFPAASGVYNPATGSYELQFSASSIGFEFYDAGYPGPVAATTDLIKADFPMGMTLSQLQLWINTETLFGPSRDRSITKINFNYFGANFYNYIPGISGLLSGTIASPDSGPNAIIPNTFVNWSIVQAMKPWGIKIDVDPVVSALLSQPRAAFSEVFILAAYNTQLLRLGPNDGEQNVLPGDLSTLESASGSLDLFDIDTFQIYWDMQDGDEESPDFPGFTGGVFIPRRNIILFTAFFLRFYMPSGLGIPYGGRRLMLVGSSNSTFFVGKVALQNYNITLVDGSGLYNLTPSKRNDTYYDRSSGPPTPTIDLKMPDPRAKTGFFNG